MRAAVLPPPTSPDGLPNEVVARLLAGDSLPLSYQGIQEGNTSLHLAAELGLSPNVKEILRSMSDRKVRTSHSTRTRIESNPSDPLLHDPRSSPTSIRRMIMVFLLSIWPPVLDPHSLYNSFLHSVPL